MTISVYAVRDFATQLPVFLFVYGLDPKPLAYRTSCPDCEGPLDDVEDGLALGLCTRCERPTRLWVRARSGGGQ